MCGIAGQFNFNSTNKIVPSSLKKMADMINHRGPDGEGFWSHANKNIGFAHRRLAIIDLSEKGRQPMTQNDLTITFNGEIYNYLELKKELIKKGHTFHTNTDTEVILVSYLEYQEDCIKHFDGMFAFAIWDERKQELFCARDRFGEKPFFYYYDKEKFWFASEMKCLFKVGINQKLSDKMIFHYLAYDVVEDHSSKSDTFYENIYQIPPSHYLKISQHGEKKLFKYWDIDPSKSIDISFDEATHHFKELFFESVKLRMRSDVNVGCSFSGGIDSSSIVASLKNLFPDIKLNTFTARFNDKNYDEGNFLDYTLNKYSLDTNFCWPDSSTLISEIDKIFYHHEEPFGSESIIAQWEVMKLAKEKNVTVLMDGQGADETLAGYYKYFLPFLTELYRNDKKIEFRTQLNFIENNLSKKNVLPDNFFTQNKFPKFYKKISDSSRPFRIKNIASDLSNDFLNTYKKEKSPFKRITNLNDFLYFDTFNYGLGKLLKVADRNSMAFSREVRLPYLSHHLVEFAFSLPSEFKMHNGWSKYILRKSMDNIVPPEICWRKDKKGYQIPKETIKDKLFDELIHDSIDVLTKEKYIDSPNSANNWKYIAINKLLNQKF